MLSHGELTDKLKEKFLDAMGSESLAAAIFENPEFLDKLNEILSWLVGEIILENLRPTPPPIRKEPIFPEPPKQWKGWVHRERWVDTGVGKSRSR